MYMYEHILTVISALLVHNEIKLCIVCLTKGACVSYIYTCIHAFV